MSMRAGWAEYFMTLATHVATRATCDRKHVGAVVVIEKRVVATGYNGSPPGMPHCDDVGHDMQDTLRDGKVVQNCVRTIHAEANAVAQAAKFGIALRGASLYVNTFPCWPCFRLIISAGIDHVYFDDAYNPDERVLQCANERSITIVGPDVWKRIQR